MASWGAVAGRRCVCSRRERVPGPQSLCRFLPPITGLRVGASRAGPGGHGVDDASVHGAGHRQYGRHGAPPRAVAQGYDAPLPGQTTAQPHLAAGVAGRLNPRESRRLGPPGPVVARFGSGCHEAKRRVALVALPASGSRRSWGLVLGAGGRGAYNPCARRNEDGARRASRRALTCSWGTCPVNPGGAPRPSPVAGLGKIAGAGRCATAYVRGRLVAGPLAPSDRRAA